MVFGNALVTTLGFEDSPWKHYVYIFPANLGQGIVYPGILFTSLATFEHADHAVSASTVYLIRSLGTVYGVSVTSAIVQTTLSVRLPDALGEIEDKWRVSPFHCGEKELKDPFFGKVGTYKRLTLGLDAGYRSDPTFGVCHQNAPSRCAAQSPAGLLRRAPLLVCGVDSRGCCCGVRRSFG
ncbi:hypothetical protein VTK56DRAFT_8184 [Thermocarpiscus australiensis]